MPRNTLQYAVNRDALLVDEVPEEVPTGISNAKQQQHQPHVRPGHPST